MIFFGLCTRDRLETGGEFTCSACGAETHYSMRRTYNYLHVYLVPIWRLDLVAEVVECAKCYRRLPVTCLASQAHAVDSQVEAGRLPGSLAVSENLGNVVSLTEAAVAEVLRRHSTGRWTTEVAIRISPADFSRYDVTFDIPLTDGRDWIGQSHHIPILVDRRDAALILGKSIDFRNGHFCDANSV